MVRFSLPERQKKLLGCGLLGGISTQADNMLSHELNFSVAVHIYKIHVFDGTFPLNISSFLNVNDHQTFQDGCMTSQRSDLVGSRDK